MACKKCAERRAAIKKAAAKAVAPLIAQVKRDREQWNRKK